MSTPGEIARRAGTVAWQITKIGDLTLVEIGLPSTGQTIVIELEEEGAIAVGEQLAATARGEYGDRLDLLDKLPPPP